MGLWFHQQEPVLRRNSSIVLEKGMILAVEPQRQHWHLQDLIPGGRRTTALTFRQISDRSAVHHWCALDADKGAISWLYGMAPSLDWIGLFVSKAYQSTTC